MKPNHFPYSSLECSSLSRRLDNTPRGSQAVRRPEPWMLTSGPLSSEAVGLIHPQALPFLLECPRSGCCLLALLPTLPGVRPPAGTAGQPLTAWPLKHCGHFPQWSEDSALVLQVQSPPFLYSWVWKSTTDTCPHPLDPGHRILAALGFPDLPPPLRKCCSQEGRQTCLQVLNNWKTSHF